MAEASAPAAASEEQSGGFSVLGFSFGGSKKDPATEATPLVKEGEGEEKKDDAEEEAFAGNESLKRTWKTVVAVVAGNSFATNCRQSMIGAFLPGEVVDRGLSSTIMGTLILSQMVAVVVISFVAPAFCKKYGTYTMYIFSLVIAAVIPWINAFVGDALYGNAFMGLMITTRIIDGLVQGITEVAGMAMMLRVSPTPEVVTLSIGVSESVRGIGTLIGPLIGGWLYEAGGFKGPYLFGGAAAVAAVLAIWWFIKPKDLGQDQVKEFGDFMTLFKIPLIWAPTIVNALTITPMGSLEATFEPFMMDDPFYLDQGIIGTILSCGAVGMAIAAVATGFLQKYVGQLTQIATGQFLMAIGGIVVGVSYSLGLTIFGYMLLTLGTGFALVVSAALMSRLVRTFDYDPVEFSEPISALMVANFALGYGIGSQSGAAIVASVGFRSNAIGMGIMSAIIPIALIGLMQKQCLGRELAAPNEGDMWEDAELKKKKGDAETGDPGAAIVGSFDAAPTSS